MKLLVTGGSGFIGTSLVELALRRGAEVLNLDVAPPRNRRHEPQWRQLDILCRDELVAVVRDFAPSCLVHLAARTDTPSGVLLHSYAANTYGTANVLAAVAASGGVDRLAVASSQFVCRPGVWPSHDELYDPHTVYGWSKVVTEQLTRYAQLDAAWVIVRPTTIWGPYSSTHPARLVRALKRGFYVHPSGACERGYGYVENVVWQLLGLLDAPRECVEGRTLYVGDRLTELRTWVDAFARQLHDRPVRTVPRSLVRLAARGGDVISRLRGEPFLLQSGRFRSMTEHYRVPMDPIFELCGEPPFSLEHAVARTLAWLESEGA